MFLKAFIPILLLNLLFRVVMRDTFAFLNEDAALILEGIRSLEAHGPFHWFYNDYGPSVIRPWQLLSFGVVGSYSTDPYHFYIVHTLLLSIAQGAFFVALRRHFSYWPAFFAALFPALTRASSESTLWLSDQHDIFLLLFGSLAYFFLISSVRTKKGAKALSFLSLFFLSCWGALYSNEKASVLPLAFLVPLYLEKGVPSVRKLGVALFSVAQVPLYFLLRHAVLGTAVGGYSDSLFGEQLLSFSGLARWAASTLTVLFWQPKGAGVLIALGCFTLLIALITILYSTKEREWLLKVFFAWLGVHLLLALPTAQYALSPTHHGFFSTRMYWMPVITGSIGLALLLRKVLTNERGMMKLLGCFALSISFLISLSGFSHSLTNIERASQFTENTNKVVDEHCTCTDTKRPQILGLPIHFSSVNVYTEASWIDYQQRIRFPEKKHTCDGNARCTLYFGNLAGSFHPIPFQSSEARLNPLVRILEEEKVENFQSDGSQCLSTRILKRYYKKQPNLRRLRIKLRESEECFRSLSSKATILLKLDDKPVAFRELLLVPLQFRKASRTDGSTPNLYFADFIVDLSENPNFSFFLISNQPPIKLKSVLGEELLNLNENHS